ncbi:MAG: type III-B CRISPR module-associated Cmr3 family protein [Saprospiraceae bacterium]
MNKYIIQFKPMGPYFFGMENRKVSQENINTDEANYFLKSSKFPQQSTILGAIRFFFLQNVCPENVFNDNQILDRDSAKDYIGAKSFDINETAFNFGRIKGISEVFLRNNNSNYLPLPFDKWSSDFGDLKQVDGTSFYFLPNYDVKKHYPMIFTNGSKQVSIDDIFLEHIQSGNKKNNKGDDDDDAFYKQQYWRLKEGWAFATELETDFEFNTSDQSYFMPMGGENRLFKIDILDNDFNRVQILRNEKSQSVVKVLLTSDAYLKKDIAQYKPIFSILQTKSFRYLSSELAKTTQYQNRSKDQKSMVASHMLEIIDRGSIFYFDNVEKATSFVLEHFPNDYLSKTGFNQNIIITNQN